MGDRYPRLDACFTPAGALGNGKVLFRAGEGPWYAVDLMQEGACHIAYLPKPLATTTEIQYFVAAVDKSFNERQQPDTAPETAYRARVVRNQGDCDRLKRGRRVRGQGGETHRGRGGRTGRGAPAVLGALLVGFSQEGVILAAAAAAGAGAAGGAAAAGAGAGGLGRRHRHGHAGHRGGRGGGGGPWSRSSRGGRRGGAVVQRERHPAESQGAIAVVDRADHLQRASHRMRPAGRTSGRAWAGCAPTTARCTMSCPTQALHVRGVPGLLRGPAAGSTDPNFCLSAAQQVVQVCN